MENFRRQTSALHAVAIKAVCRTVDYILCVIEMTSEGIAIVCWERKFVTEGR